jgi:uncharacterized protein with HEPN domain
MKTKRLYRDYVLDILDAIRKAEKFADGMTLEDFKQDEKTIFAVVRALEVVGEATKFIPRTVRNKYRDVPWKAMAGMRDKLIHEYFGVNIRIVWNTLKKDLPKIVPVLEEILQSVNMKSNNQSD